MIYIALLRAVNVSGKNIIKMAALKQLCEGLGLGRVQTYIQSGNILFESDEAPSLLRGRLEGAIAENFGLTVTVIMRTLPELASAAVACPFPAHDGLYVTYLEAEPSAEAVERLMGVQSEAEQVRVLGREAYLLYRDGAGKAKLTNAVLEKRLGLAATARNWRTTLKLLELAEAMIP